MFESPPFWMYILGFLLLLGPLITLHELGHYLVGRWSGVKADIFSIGFGKEIAGFTDRHGTRWRLSVLPLGGYVQFKGDMNPASVPDSDAIAAAGEAEREGSFHHASLGKRALIVAAGPVANILVTLAIFAGFFMAIGYPVAKDAEQQLTIAAFPEGSPARKAGIELGDRIVAIEGKRVDKLMDVQQAVMAYPDEVLGVRVERDGKPLDFSVRTMSMEVTDRFGNPSRIGLIGIQAAEAETEFVPQGLFSSVGLAVEETGRMTVMMVTGIKQIVTGQRSVKELGGPIKIAKYSGEQLSLGWLSFVNFAALISLNLAFINLLPIPGLDGGHLAFYAAEAVRRKPVGARGMEWAYRTGMALVLMLMLFVTFNDLVSLSPFG
ncbi:RIP metalloprotease RseP [Erythrobacter sp. SDW2]|uniref:RIP metalloprotease RseP n=1 Tax=Erythrobacter sp. SDW2 TaxID=2907154 RepID=UPI001F4342A5|nr:RIP metalloprotease RseP [Erythrobacter sp. SDW2]UIP06114.1 RIP metalloprotease RseP [Erythrobacter sp. SDW2]